MKYIPLLLALCLTASAQIPPRVMRDMWRAVPSPSSANYITSGLIGWWKFNENTGTNAADSSGNNYAGVFTNGVSLWTNGVYGSAVKFDVGKPCFIGTNCPSLIWMQKKETTICFWIIGDGGNGEIMGKSDSNVDSGWSIGKNGNTISVTFINNGADGFYQFLVPSSTCFVVISWTGSGSASEMVAYTNSVTSTYSARTAGSNDSATDAADPFCIGWNIYNRYGGGNYFTGVLDDVRIYNRALSSNEVSQIYSGQ